MSTVLIVVWVALTVWLTVRDIMVISFYRGYFRQMQENLGKDPDATVREAFPWAWWVF